MTEQEREEVYRMRVRLGSFICGGEPADLDGPLGSAVARTFHRRAAHRTVARMRLLARGVRP